MVVMAPYTNMPDDVKKIGRGDRSRDHRRQAASLQMPGARAGRQAGRVQGRHHLDDGQILGMNFYVKGVDDKMPGK